MIETLRQVAVGGEEEVDSILIVEGDAELLQLLEAELGGPNRRIITAETSARAGEILEREDIALVLLDLSLPDEDGRNLLARLRDGPKYAGVPIIVVSARLETRAKVECYSLGSDEVFEKPVDLSALSAAVASKLVRAREISREAQRDPLTGLLNRAGLNAAFERARALAARADYPLCLALLDLDRFKAVNDRLGHARGDEVLRRVAEVFSRTLRKSDRAARWGGDEFIILFPNADLKGAARALEKLVDRLRREPLLGGGGQLQESSPGPPGMLNLGCSAGVTRVTAEQELDAVVAEADQLLYLAKAAGGGQVMIAGQRGEIPQPSPSGSGNPTVAAPLPPIGRREWLPEATPTASQSGPPPVFVGRELELGQLERFLATALAGPGLVAFVRGEAGTGKTALLGRFAELAQQDHPELVIAGGRCNAHTSIGDPYLPFCEVLAQLTSDIEARWAAGTMTRQQASGLWELLPHSVAVLLSDGRGLIDTFVAGAALVARARARRDLSAAAVEELSRLATARESGSAGAAATQRDLFEQYTRVLRGLARGRPLLVLLDDLQWADSGSISLLFHLGKRLAGNGILILGAYRPTEIALGRGGERHPLEPVLNELRRDFGTAEVDLDRSAGRHFVDAFLDAEPNQLGAAFRQTLHRQTGGHALYTVELVREMEDQGTLVHDHRGRWIEGPALDWTRVPARVEAVIGERIGRLPEDLRELLTLASVEGEDFTAEVAARALELDELGTVRRLSRELDQRHRLVEPRGIELIAGRRLSRYRFRHHLFQKYLYSRLAAPDRAYLHDQVGTVLEATYGERASEISTRLARHFEEAGRAEKAVRYLQQAAEKAVRQSAHREAVAHLTKGLALLESLPAGESRARRELELLTALGPVLMVVKGWAAPETERAYTRARDLAQRLGQPRKLFPILWGLWQSAIVRAELESSCEMADQLVALAEQVQDPTLFPAAYRTQGESSFWLGELDRARAFSERGFGLYDPERHRSHGFIYGTDPGAFCLGFWGWSLWCLGYPDQAAERIRQMVAVGRDTSHPFSLAMAHCFAAMTHQVRHAPAAAKESAESAMALADKEGFEILSALAMIPHGWALAELGQAGEGIAEIRQGLELYPSPLVKPWSRSLLAEALAATGDHQAALKALAEGLSMLERTEERWWEAELHRLRGESLAERGAAAGEVEACFRRALEVARRQGAKSLELRAATSLARLLKSRRREEEARRILEELYSWFSEGFDTRDLRQAADLLESLRQVATPRGGR